MKRRIVLIGLISLIAAAVAAAVLRFAGADAGVEISWHGYLAVGLGVGFSLLFGFGLMSLVYFSARRGYDDIDGGPASPPHSAGERLPDKRL